MACGLQALLQKEVRRLAELAEQLARLDDGERKVKRIALPPAALPVTRRGGRASASARLSLSAVARRPWRGAVCPAGITPDAAADDAAGAGDGGGDDDRESVEVDADLARRAAPAMARKSEAEALEEERETETLPSGVEADGGA